MKRLTIVFYVFLVCVCNPFETFSDTWPKLNNGDKFDQCGEALQIAKAAFKSDSFHLFAPPIIPTELGSILVLKPQALDISGGDALEADQATFDKLPKDEEGAPRSIYWQKTARYGYRLVVHEVPYGWRGDMYSLFAIGEEVRPEEFLSEVKNNHRKSKFIPIISDRWRPPLLLQEKHSGQIWIIDVGQPYQFLGDWRIHVSERDGIKFRCTVQFRPNVRKAVSLLPPPVRKLARLLDQTIGPGENEGTLQPTAGLRLYVEHTWANAALRPWALTEPYNTREEVDTGLLGWSRSGATYLKTYENIEHQYPLAEKSLAAYYQRYFHRTADEAKSLSAYVLDIALRSHYSFHSDAPNSYFRFDGPQFNPWRKIKEK